MSPKKRFETEKQKQERIEKEKLEKLRKIYTCRHCEHCTEVKRFHTLSIKGEPTLGECPYNTTSRCVLLSAIPCEHFSLKKEYITDEGV